MKYQPSSDLKFHKCAESSKSIFEYLTDGIDFDIGDVNLDPEMFKIPDDLVEAFKQKVPSVTEKDVTTREIHGSGMFDGLMEAVEKHLHREYEESRITGTEYANAYVQAMNVCIQSSIQFVLNKDKSNWDAVVARMNALTSTIGVYTAQAQLAIARAQANTHKAQYGATVMQLAVADANYRLQQEQILSAHEQAEAYHAQTAEDRLDGSGLVMGTLKRQKDLYEQQVESFKRDAELKAAKVWTEAWQVEATVTDEVKPPKSFNIANLHEILSVIQKNNKLGEFKKAGSDTEEEDS